MAEAAAGGQGEEEERPRQSVLVMRHSDRLDCEDWMWKKTAARPYDTPLSGKGLLRAREVGIRRCQGKDIKLVISSPFLRCLQTAQEVAGAMDLKGVVTCNALCELLTPGSNIVSTPEVPGDDIHKYNIQIDQLDSQPLPAYPETLAQSEERYRTAIQELADKHWPDSLVLVTHQYGVNQALVVGGRKKPYMYEVTFCGNVELRREDRTGEWRIVSTHNIYEYDEVC